ncbi:hypothetical protein EDB83DRAFT_2381522 [Lactarius deliciosus]|nr:hypothetical protein EDB83DRAFT_2381522 [Lactarius deliciosus]
MDASHLGRFIERVGTQMSLSRADVETSVDAISISFANSTASARKSAPLRFHIACKQLDWQLSSMAQVCDQFSPFLFRVNRLRINMAHSPSGQDDVDGGQWLDLIRAFVGATGFRVTSKLMTATFKLCALDPVEEGHTIVLPSLHHLRAENRRAMDVPSWDALLSFVTLRSRSGPGTG